MAYYYSANRNVQLLVALLKAHGIRTVVASPGTTNMELVGSLQHDGSFEMYSLVSRYLYMLLSGDIFRAIAFLPFSCCSPITFNSKYLWYSSISSGVILSKSS